MHSPARLARRSWSSSSRPIERQVTVGAGDISCWLSEQTYDGVSYYTCAIMAGHFKVELGISSRSIRH